jgi:hypothetical protein
MGSLAALYFGYRTTCLERPENGIRPHTAHKVGE